MRCGFTLLEMLVSLAIGALIIGAVMGLISESLRYKINLKEKAQSQPVLESAAQIILADPVKATQGLCAWASSKEPLRWVFSCFRSSLSKHGAEVIRPVVSGDANYKSANLEFSIIIPNSDLKR